MLIEKNEILFSSVFYNSLLWPMFAAEILKCLFFFFFFQTTWIKLYTNKNIRAEKEINKFINYLLINVAIRSPEGGGRTCTFIYGRFMKKIFIT